MCFVLLVSFGCAFFLWYQRILPPVFKEGEKSEVQLLNAEERTVLDIQATDEQKRLAKTETIKKFLSKPNFKRDDSSNAQSLDAMMTLIEDLDRFFTFKEKYRPKYSEIPSDELFASILFTSEDDLELIFSPGNQTDKSIHGKERLFKNKDFDYKKDGERFLKTIKSLQSKWQLVSIENPDLISKLLIDYDVCSFDKSDWIKVKPYLLNLSRQVLGYGYYGNIDTVTLKEMLAGESISEENLNLIKTLINASLSPNIHIDVGFVDSLEDSVTMEVKPVLKSIPAHSVIIQPGELITKDKLTLINQLGLNHKQIDWKVFQEAFWMTLLIVLSFWLYVRFEKFQLSFRQTLLLSFLMIGASAFIGFFGFKQPATIPLAAIAMTTGLFFKPTVGFSAGVLFGILCLQALEINPVILIPSFVGVIVGTVLSQKANNRADLAYSGIWLAISQIISFVLLALVSKDVDLSVSEVTLQGLSGLFTALLVSSGMPYLESFFSVITRFRLLELSDSNQELLKQLHEEAPGTYEHTLVVADLAQDAARAIDADDELVRVGILYHDIGKLYNPQYFIENQFGGPNPHDSMTPAESARAIIAHVTEGIELAKKHGLPEPIRAFIPAHQGDSRAGHFFLKARQLDPNLVDDADFRYPGPKPNSKETGIAMLADTVEATIRSLKTDDKDLVKETIKNLIDSRVKDKQLLDSTLTETELNKIANSFFESWKNKNHERVKYISDLKRS